MNFFLLAQHILEITLSLKNFSSSFNAYFFGFFFLKAPQKDFFIYLLINFTRLQEFFSILFNTAKIYRAFSSGFLLKIFLILEKKQRRNIKKHKPVLVFLKKFFLSVFSAGAEFWFLNFKKKYLSVIFAVLSWTAASGLVWIFKKSFGKYTFRRMKAIKKRIRRAFEK